MPASKLDGQVNIKIKKEREKLLMKLCQENLEELIANTRWKTVKVLIEQDNKGWTDNYLKYESKRNTKSWDILETIF